ncbi:MAG TPA: hypothetical protein VF499_00840, partial [Afipia sp.]
MIWLSVKVFFSLRWRALMLGVSARAGGANPAMSARQPAMAAMPAVSRCVVEDMSIAVELAITPASRKGTGGRLTTKQQKGRPRRPAFEELCGRDQADAASRLNLSS